MVGYPIVLGPCGVRLGLVVPISPLGRDLGDPILGGRVSLVLVHSMW